MVRILLFVLLFASAPMAAVAQNALCDNPQASCGARVQSTCLTRLGAGSLGAPGDECGAQLGAYADCLRQVVSECGGHGAGDVGLLQRTPSMGVSFLQAGEMVLIEKVRVGAVEAYRPLLQPGAFVMQIPKIALTRTQWDAYALVVHASRSNDLYRVPIENRCWLCADDRIWPTGGSGMADSVFGSGQLFLTRYWDPRQYDKLTGFNYLVEPRIKDKGEVFEVYISSLIDLDADAEFLRQGETVFLTLVDGDMVDEGKGKLRVGDFERIVLRF